MKNKIIPLSILIMITILVLLNLNYEKKVKKILKPNSYITKLDENSEEAIYEIIGELSTEEIVEIFQEASKISTIKKRTLIFTTSKQYNDSDFYDNTLIGKGFISNDESKLEYYTNIKIFPTTEIRNKFNVTNVYEENNVVFINIEINGDDPYRLVGEAKKITEEIIRLNNIDKEVRTFVDTNSKDYEVSTKSEGVIKTIKYFEK